MFFLLRCVFWLSIVYASILSTDDWRHVPADSQEVLGRAGQTALTTAAHYCSGRSVDCLSEAARLTALIDASTTGSATHVHETGGKRPVGLKHHTIDDK